MHLFYGQREFLVIIEFSHRWHENVGGRYQLESRDRVVHKSSSWWSIITGDSWPINSVFALSWQMEQKSEHVGFKVSRCNRNRIEFAVFTLPLNLCVHPPCRCSSFKKILSRITREKLEIGNPSFYRINGTIGILFIISSWILKIS